MQDKPSNRVVDDNVNHPKHYTGHPSGVECITITEHMSFCLGNAVKYIWRADLKNDAIEDLEKAKWYISREIERRQSALHAGRSEDDDVVNKTISEIRHLLRQCPEGWFKPDHKLNGSYLHMLFMLGCLDRRVAREEGYHQWEYRSEPLVLWAEYKSDEKLLAVYQSEQEPKYGGTLKKFVEVACDE